MLRRARVCAYTGTALRWPPAAGNRSRDHVTGCSWTDEPIRHDRQSLRPVSTDRILPVSISNHGRSARDRQNRARLRRHRKRADGRYLRDPQRDRGLRRVGRRHGRGSARAVRVRAARTRRPGRVAPDVRVPSRRTSRLRTVRCSHAPAASGSATARTTCDDARSRTW